MKRGITRIDQRLFLTQLKAAVVEKDVESAYKSIFQKYYNTTFPSPYGSDGYIEPNQTSLVNEDLRLLLEVKFQHELTRSNERAKIVIQAIYYLKKFQLDGRQLPNVILGGDENEMFTVYVPKLHEYLNKDYDWNVPPSSAWKHNQDLYKKLVDDPNLNVFVFDVRSTTFDINEVFKSIDLLSHEVDFKKIRVSESNIRKVFDEFIRVVFGNEWMTGIKKLGPQETVSLFIQSILGDTDVYIVPTKKNVLHMHGGKEIVINTNNYDAFFSRYDRKYSVKDIDAITAVADQLIEEIKRRFHGDFWTPTIWSERAIEMITSNLGNDWRESYIVWDPAAGTKNLTRDYRFKNLYTSTLHQAEIDMSRHYNAEAVSFQYDFLNDDIDINPESDPRDLKMPLSLFESLKNNDPIVFYTNPPYGQAGTHMGEHKEGIADTAIGTLMRQKELGLASAELYTQFMFRIHKLVNDFALTNVNFYFFMNKGFLTSRSFSKFTDILLNDFRFNDGFMFNAGEFEGTSSSWGIIFANFQLELDNNPQQDEFDFSIEQTGLHGIEKISTHTLRRLKKDDQTLGDWSKDNVTVPEKNNGQYPRLKGPLAAATSQSSTLKFPQDAIGSMVYDGDAVQNSDSYVFILSSLAQKGHNRVIPITPRNFKTACFAFAARKSILPDATWYNDKDVFRAPSITLQNSQQWNELMNDSVVYSLFHRSSLQTSLRSFEYVNNSYNLPNEWFYMSSKDIIELSEKYELNELIYDARSSNESFIYNFLSNQYISVEAQNLLESGRKLLIETFSRRYLTNQEHPQWQLMCWDAGFYQIHRITTIFKEEFTGVIKEFNDSFMTLETKIRNQVYLDKILEK